MMIFHTIQAIGSIKKIIPRLSKGNLLQTTINQRAGRKAGFSDSETLFFYILKRKGGLRWHIQQSAFSAGQEGLT